MGRNAIKNYTNVRKNYARIICGIAHLYSVQMYFCNKILISRVPLYRVKNTSFVLRTTLLGHISRN